MARYFNKKNVISLLVGAVVMFIMSFVWHSVFLNDFNRILFPKILFYIGLAVSYIGISFLITVLYSSGKLKLGPHLSAFVIGVLTGVFIYLIALTLGFSFNNSLTMQQALIDLCWQVIEEGIGGLVIAISFQIFEHGGFFIHI